MSSGKVNMQTDIREYGEEYPVEVRTDEETGRLVIIAYNEGKNNITLVDLLDVIEFYEKHKGVLRNE